MIRTHTVLEPLMFRGFSLFAKPKPFWPEPDLSRGDELRLMRDRNGASMRCWDTLTGDGTVFAAFLNIKVNILDCLENHPKLNSAGQIPATGLSCCLVGSDPDAINPAIIVHCENEPYRKRAVKIISRQHWWKVFETRHPSFILLTSRRAPTPAASPSQQSHATVSTSDKEPNELSTVSERIFYAEPSSFGRCGAAAEFLAHDTSRSLSDRSIATIGGYLVVDGSLFGLTVAHPLKTTTSEGSIVNQRPSTSIGESAEWDVDSFDNDSAASDGSSTPDSEGDDTEVEHSKIKRTIVDVRPKSDPGGMGTLNALPRRSRSGATIELASGVRTNDNGGGKLGRETSNYGRTDRELLYEDMMNAGVIQRASLDFEENDLDWALCKFHESEAASTRINLVPLAQPLIHDTLQVVRVGPVPGAGRGVLVKTALPAPRVGIINGAPYLYRAPNAKRFFETVLLDMRTELEIGDCGSWVFDRDGTWYGTIIAIQFEKKQSLFVPAVNLLRDMENKLKVKVDMALPQSSLPSAGPELSTTARPLITANESKAQVTSLEHSGVDTVSHTPDDHVVHIARELALDAVRLSMLLNVIRRRTEETTSLNRALSNFSSALREPIELLEKDTVRTDVDGICTPVAVDFMARLLGLAQEIFDEISFALEERIARQEEPAEASPQPVFMGDIELLGEEDQRLFAQVIDVLTTNLTMVVRLVTLGSIMASTSRYDDMNRVREMKDKILWARTEVRNLGFVSEMQLIIIHRLFKALRANVKARQADGQYPILEADLLELANVPLGDSVASLDQVPTSHEQMLATVNRGVDKLLSRWTRWYVVRINRDHALEKSRILQDSAYGLTRRQIDPEQSGRSTPSLKPLEENKIYQHRSSSQIMPPPPWIHSTRPASQSSTAGTRHAQSNLSRSKSPTSSISSFVQTKYSEQPRQSSRATTPSFPRSELGESTHERGKEGFSQRGARKDVGASRNILAMNNQDFVTNLELWAKEWAADEGERSTSS